MCPRQTQDLASNPSPGRVSRGGLGRSSASAGRSRREQALAKTEKSNGDIVGRLTLGTPGGVRALIYTSKAWATKFSRRPPRVLSQQMRHTGRCVSTPRWAGVQFSLTKRVTACGCVLIALRFVLLRGFARQRPPWVNRGGLYRRACTRRRYETAGLLSAVRHPRSKAGRGGEISQRRQNPAATKKSRSAPITCQQSTLFRPRYN